MAPKKSVKPFVIILIIVSTTFLFGVFKFREQILQFSGLKEKRDLFIGLQYDIHGIDISRYQGRVNWDELATTTVNGKPLKFVYIKATEGSTLSDVRFKRNWQQARKVGLKRGAYHYYKPNTSAKSQAEFFAKQVKMLSGDLPPVLDLEESGGKSKEELQSDLRLWLKIVEEKCSVKPIIYVNLNYYKHFIKNDFDEYLVWIAHYNTPKPRLADSHWHFWQHTDKGLVGGILHQVDLNVFNGNEEEFEAICIQ